MTPTETLLKAKKIAEEAGLQYVYIGNIPGSPAESTFCPECKELIIKRRGYSVIENRLNEGKCPECGAEIEGVWPES